MGQSLQDVLQRLDGKSYKAYRDLDRCYSLEHFDLLFDRIQGDPFAAPSQCRVLVRHEVTQLQAHYFDNPEKAIAFRDFLNRQCFRQASKFSSNKGSGKSGLISIAKPSQAILSRSAVLLHQDCIEVRFTVGLPAYGRRIAGQEAITLLCKNIPNWLKNSVFQSAIDIAALQLHLQTYENTVALRKQLSERGLVAFIANDAVLPRENGVSDRPLKNQVKPFKAPQSLTVTLNRPHGETISGLGIPEGVTLLVGGGFHGKSTLLQAIQHGIYNHIPSDGRESVVSLPSTVKIRSEEGRSICNVDVSPFINNLPLGQSTASFSTENASGSTSQAASIIESIEADSKLLLLDEDTCATNFMIRDRRMQALIGSEKEPITPFIDQVRSLYTECQISSILVIGGCGDYFDVADTVIALDEFCPQDKTQEAKAIATQFPSNRDDTVINQFSKRSARVLKQKQWFRSKHDRRLKIKVHDLKDILIGDQTLQLEAHEQWKETGQLKAIAHGLIQLEQKLKHASNSCELDEIVSPLWQEIKQKEWDALTTFPEGNLVEIRLQDLYFALNRLRSLQGFQ